MRDSDFGNSVLKTARKIDKVTGMDLVDETGEIMVISQFGKIIRIDTKSIRGAGRSTKCIKLLDPRTPGQSNRLSSHLLRRSQNPTRRGTLLRPRYYSLHRRNSWLHFSDSLRNLQPNLFRHLTSS